MELTFQQHQKLPDLRAREYIWLLPEIIPFFFSYQSHHQDHSDKISSSILYKPTYQFHSFLSLYYIRFLSYITFLSTFTYLNTTDHSLPRCFSSTASFLPSCSPPALKMYQLVSWSLQIHNTDMCLPFQFLDVRVSSTHTFVIYLPRSNFEIEHSRSVSTRKPRPQANGCPEGHYHRCASNGTRDRPSPDDQHDRQQPDRHS